MSRNIFRRCEAYLEAGGHQVSNLLCNNVSRTARRNKVWNCRQIRACYALRRMLTAAVLKDTRKILSALRNATVTSVNHSCLIYKKNISQWRNTMVELQNSACIEADPDSSVCYPNDNFCTGWAHVFLRQQEYYTLLHSTSELFWDVLFRAYCSVLSYVGHVSHKQYRARHLRVPNCTTSSAMAGVANLGSLSCWDPTSRKAKH